MNSYTMHNLATIRQNELLSEADAIRRAKAARKGAADGDTRGWQPFGWLRHTTAVLTSHLTPHAPATNGRHS